MNTIRLFAFLAVFCWILAIAIGSGLFEIKSETRAAIFTWLSLAAGVAFYALVFFRS